jgi:hypothetical protein
MAQSRVAGNRVKINDRRAFLKNYLLLLLLFLQLLEFLRGSSR